MGRLIIRNLDENLMRRLHRRAARHRRSIDEEARVLLVDSLTRQQPRKRRLLGNVAETIAAIFDPLGRVEHNLRTREPFHEAKLKRRND
jgi:plasmid stability protein